MADKRLRLLVLVLAGTTAACSGAGSGGGSGGASTPVAAAPVPAGTQVGGGGGGGGATGGPVAEGGDLCGLLGPGDWAAVGVTDAQAASENNMPPDAYFCVYRGLSSATGGLEMDVFLSPSADEAAAALPEMFTEFSATGTTDVTVPGADHAQLHLPTFEGTTDPALIGVQSGRLTVGLGMGSTFADAQQNGERLKQLAALILTRAEGLGQ
jgi:hypothetical protein